MLRIYAAMLTSQINFPYFNAGFTTIVEYFTLLLVLTVEYIYINFNPEILYRTSLQLQRLYAGTG